MHSRIQIDTYSSNRSSVHMWAKIVKREKSVAGGGTGFLFSSSDASSNEMSLHQVLLFAFRCYGSVGIRRFMPREKKGKQVCWKEGLKSVSRENRSSSFFCS